MLSARLSVLLVLVVLSALAWSAGPKQPSAGSSGAILSLSDAKEWKKLIKAKNNVLVAFFQQKASSSPLWKIIRESSENLRGVGTIVTVECYLSDAKKLCKKLKASPPSSPGFTMKHYRNGEFHMDYNRPVTVRSINSFMKDPTGDLPWDEDPTSADVHHFSTRTHLEKFIKKEKNAAILVMFYAPWCGFCKRMKPDYQKAATDLKADDSIKILAAVDVTRPENAGLSKKYNVTGFPTLVYFENGAMQYQYPGDNTREALVDFMRNPSPDAKVVIKDDDEPAWKTETSEVVHLKDSTFASFMESESSVLVMFYAPWCGHCKRMKPKFVAAAQRLKDKQLEGKFAAVDCTTETKTAKQFEVRGYPTLKYFRDGKLAFDASHAREEEDLVSFMSDPREPPPPPPPEVPWAEQEDAQAVMHLTDLTFKQKLKGKKHVLVMFYAPWCGHCKKAKLELLVAAHHFTESPKVELGAVDCTTEMATCSNYDVSGYPTFKYFKYFDKEPVRSYSSGRTAKDFIAFLEDPDNLASGQPPAPPPPEQDWQGLEGAEHVIHLTDKNLNEVLSKSEHALVVFYAPWCGHCKAMKDDYAAAAGQLAGDSPRLLLAAVDATSERATAQKFKVQGYPTIKYFRGGEYVSDYESGRSKSDFVDYLSQKAIKKEEL